MKMRYIYSPGITDLINPTIVKGQAITPGSVVSVSRKMRAYMLPSVFACIVDDRGNVQNVWRKALRKVNED